MNITWNNLQIAPWMQCQNVTLPLTQRWLLENECGTIIRGYFHLFGMHLAILHGAKSIEIGDWKRKLQFLRRACFLPRFLARGETNEDESSESGTITRRFASRKTGRVRLTFSLYCPNDGRKWPGQPPYITERSHSRKIRLLFFGTIIRFDNLPYNWFLALGLERNSSTYYISI